MKIGLKLWSTNTDFYLADAKRLFEMGAFDYIELYIVPQTLHALPKWRELEIPFIIHAPHFAHGVNLALENLAESNLERYKEVKDFAGALNAKHIIFHAGTGGNWQESAKQIASFKDKRIIVENKPLRPQDESKSSCECRGSSPAEIENIMRAANCGFCLDFAHAIAAANSYKKAHFEFLSEFLKLKPAMFHLCDALRLDDELDTHTQLGKGVLDLKKIARLMPQNAIVSIETDKASKENLNDFIADSNYLKNIL